MFKVCFVPARSQIDDASIIHSQKRDGGFFQHPVLVVASHGELRTAEFYAMTSFPPKAIHDLKMYLHVGKSTVNEGPDTLRLAAGSDKMPRKSYLNLDQRFTLEWKHLNEMPWNVDVSIDLEERKKLDFKISQLEAQQNRCKSPVVTTKKPPTIFINILYKSNGVKISTNHFRKASLV